MNELKELQILLKQFSIESPNLKKSIKRKGTYKYLLLVHFIKNILKINGINGEILIEVYKYFIRLRRFLFKLINYIEDYLTSLYLDSLLIENKNNINEFKKIVTEDTFAMKIDNFINKEDFYHLLKKSNKDELKLPGYQPYLEKLNRILFIRNSIAHIDIFYLNLNNWNKFTKSRKNKQPPVGDDMGKISIINLIKTIGCFVSYKNNNKYKTINKEFDEVVNKMENEKVNNDDYLFIVEKINKFIFNKNNSDIEYFI